MKAKTRQFLSFRLNKCFSLSVLGLALILLLNLKSILIRYGQWLSPSTSNPSGEIAVVLAGNPHRLQAGVQLLARGQVQAIYSASPSPDIDPTSKNQEGQILVRLLKNYEIPQQKSYWGLKTVKNTFDEALTFQQTMAYLGWHPDRLVLVSDPYHLQRAFWAFRLVLGESVRIQTYGTSKPDSEWWRDRQSRQWVGVETQKMLWYWLYYGLLQSKTPLSPRDFFRLYGSPDIMG